MSSISNDTDCRLYLQGNIGVLGAEAMVRSVVEGKGSKYRVYRSDVYNKIAAPYVDPERAEKATVSAHKFKVLDPDDVGYGFVVMTLSVPEGCDTPIRLPNGHGVFIEDYEKHLIDIALPSQTTSCTVLVAPKGASSLMQSIAEVYGGVYLDVATKKTKAFSAKKSWTSEIAAKNAEGDISDAVSKILERYGMTDDALRDAVRTITTAASSTMEAMVPDIRQASAGVQREP